MAELKRCELLVILLPYDSYCCNKGLLITQTQHSYDILCAYLTHCRTQKVRTVLLLYRCMTIICYNQGL